MATAVKRVIARPMSAGAPSGVPLPDRLHVIRQYRRSFGRLRFGIRPRRFSELLLAKMLWDRDPLLPITTEKVDARGFVASRVGTDYLIPLLQVSDRAERIDLEALPARFAIKASHGCGFNLLVGDKSQIDAEALRATLRGWLATDWYRRHREWAYRGVPRRILVEALLVDHGELAADYKFYVFNGRARMVMVNGRSAVAAVAPKGGRHPTRDYFDERWQPLRVERGKPRAAVTPPRPDRLAEMIDVAERIARDFAFCRVDLYNVEGRIYFGEITHYPSAGQQMFRPLDFDAALGEVWLHGTPIPQRFYA